MSKAKLLQLKLIHIFARAILLMKKFEIEVHFYNISFKSWILDGISFFDFQLFH